MKDTIYREDAIKAFKPLPTIEGLGLQPLITVDDAIKILNCLPSAQPERKTGRWILWNYPGEECAICSACGEEYDQMELYIGGNDYPKYCPNCGADMRGEQNEQSN